MDQLWKRLWSEERGQNVSEFALLLVLVSLFAASVAGIFGVTIRSSYSMVSTATTSAAASGSGSSASLSRAGSISLSGTSNTSGSGSSSGPVFAHGDNNGQGQGLAPGHN